MRPFIDFLSISLEIVLQSIIEVSDEHEVIRTILGECKFRRNPMGFSAYNTLVSRSKSAKFTENIIFILFSASGFEEELCEFAEDSGVILVDGKTLMGDSEPPILFK